MAEEKPRAPRARKKTTEAETEAAEGKTTAKRPSRAKAAASTPKPAREEEDGGRDVAVEESHHGRGRRAA